MANSPTLQTSLRLEGTSEGTEPGQSTEVYDEASGERRVLNNIYSVTDSRGYLLKHPDGSNVPVGIAAARHLSVGFTDREVAILFAVEQMGAASVEQLARVFFNSHKTAYNVLLELAHKRFVVSLGADAMIVRRAVAHKPPVRNPVYALDRNGAYFLSCEHNCPLLNWRPSTAALITARLSHTLGISEVWSYLLAAARATHERIDDVGAEVGQHTSGQLIPHLSVAYKNERASLIIQGASPTAKANAQVIRKDKVLLQPDGAFILEIATRDPQIVDMAAPTARGNSVGTNSAPAAEKPLPSLDSPRWSPTLNSWSSSFLSQYPTSEVMRASERLAIKDPLRPYYRTLLLEMETGANNMLDTKAKIAGYNRLIKADLQVWEHTYGIAPRVLVVVSNDRQIPLESLHWRLHYFYKQESAVLITSLQTLDRVFGAERSAILADKRLSNNLASKSVTRSQAQHKRRSLIEQPCFLDVMVDRWKPLGEALGVGFVPTP